MYGRAQGSDATPNVGQPAALSPTAHRDHSAQQGRNTTSRFAPNRNLLDSISTLQRGARVVRHHRSMFWSLHHAQRQVLFFEHYDYGASESVMIPGTWDRRGTFLESESRRMYPPGNIMPLFGTWIADAHCLGRFNIIYMAVSVTLLGHIILTITDVLGTIGAFSVALIVMGLSIGMFKANISPPVAE
ncbi:hypothetical protein BD779DRAFT_623401 [Infundibulicybe gibba]|nr:hypothetical protein BD779DRAFT_623401 [Infundibulicybe gibba]